MSTFPTDLRFIHVWRPYQARVLEALDRHTDDQHLHVVAAPGAGKTVLGLEVLRRFDRPALVLVPSLTIRNQWLNHFGTTFQSDSADLDEYVSGSLAAPAALTVSTYQALYTAVAKDDDAFDALSSVQTLVLDEAHHLRNEWWKALMSYRDQSELSTIVSLTATPPYDVSPGEWNRYYKMCGPIDEVISIPELVKAGNLCPHEDYVWFCTPAAEVSEDIEQFRNNVEGLLHWLLSSDGFERALAGHPWFSNFDSDQHREAVFANPEVFSAMVICMEAMGHDCTTQKQFLGVAKHPTPKPDKGWFEVLLSEMVSSREQHFDLSRTFRRELRARLADIQAVRRGRVVLSDPEFIDRALRRSDSKLDSVIEVVAHEHEAQGDELRLVVLTDHVRGEQVRTEDASRELGAVPITRRLFRRLRDLPMAMLTGSLVILPAASVAAFEAALADCGHGGAVRSVPLPHEPSLRQVSVEESMRQAVTTAITALLNRGDIQVIVGTVALLGQGWDAPATNTLVIASSASSYVQTNQIRGRAIRIDPATPDKVSNIWHIVCVETGSTDGGADFRRLRRRFDAFLGLSYDGTEIRSGFERLFKMPSRWQQDSIDALNEHSSRLAKNRHDIAEGWARALVPKTSALREGLVEEVGVERDALVDQRIVGNPFRRSLIPVATLAAYVPIAATSAAPLLSPAAVLVHGAVLGGVTALFGLPNLVRDLWQVARSGVGPVALSRVADVALRALVKTGQIKTPLSTLSVSMTSDSAGRSVCALHGASLRESDLFVRCVEEVLDPVSNPRYLLFIPRRGLRRGAGDYHSVPSLFHLKEGAEIFADEWRKTIGRCELVFTRRTDGRAKLLRARAEAWVNHRQKITSRQSVWR